MTRNLAILLLLGLSACNDSETKLNGLVVGAMDYGWSCRDLGKSREDCRKLLRSDLKIPEGQK